MHLEELHHKFYQSRQQTDSKLDTSVFAAQHNSTQVWQAVSGAVIKRLLTLNKSDNDGIYKPFLSGI